MKWILSSALVVFVFVSFANAGGPILPQEKDELNKSFTKLWNEPLVWKLDDLPVKGYVHTYRVPYAGSIYPDNSGGTYDACRKYDFAYHRGQMSASSYERWDTRAHKTMTESPGGLFGFRTVMRNRVPDWSGHCNGWTAAAIRHAEPKKNVTRNGVVFTPTDIKGLLAELYTFTDTEFLGGAYENVINPAAFHLTLANWVGRKKHSIAMESSPGKEVWNFPIYAYNTKITNNGRFAEVKVTMAYKQYTEGEFNEAPKNTQHKYFHYQLSLNNKGEITGGSFYRDSEMIDLLWVPLTPTQGGTKGNENGNPHLNTSQILSLWRDSVDKELVDKWVNIETPKAAPVIAKPEETKPETDEPAAETADGSEITTRN